MATDLTQNTRALKTIVIGLGIAIAVMFVVIVVTIATRLSGANTKGPAVAATLELAPGEHVEQMVGAGPNVVLRVVGGPAERLMTVDPANGRLVAVIGLNAPADAPPPD